MTSQTSALKGIAFMALYALCQSLVWVIVRILSTDYPPELLVFYRNLFGALALVPFLWRERGQGFRPKRPMLHLLRGGIACMGVYSLFFAVSAAPLAEVTAITYGAPLFAGIFAIFLFKEKADASHVLGYVFGFVGMLIVVQPSVGGGASDAYFGLMAAVLGTVMTAAAFLTVKALSKIERHTIIVAGQFAVLLPFSFFIALPRWKLPDAKALLLLALMGVGFTFAQAAMARAFAHADAVTVLPVDYLRLVIAAIAAALLLGEVPAITTWFGAALIVGSALLISYRNLHTRNRKTRTDLKTPT